jgi:ornithine cyclodeaminase/alanine dehydrogenase-like protein (mu-crystallin family)
MAAALAAFSCGRVLQPVYTMLTIEEGQVFEEVRVWSRTRDHAERFAAAHGAVAMAAEAAVRGADVVVAATSA